MKEGQRKRIAIISTGGTIEKTYDELGGVLENRISVLDVMLASLQLDGIEIDRVPLMNKDSLEMTPADHERIADEVEKQVKNHDGVVITHGTDRLAVTGEAIHSRLFRDASRAVTRHGIPRTDLLGAGVEDDPAHDAPLVPIVLIGAMRPYALRRTDALQNLTEALLAVQILPPGVYCVMHNRVLQFPGVVKNRERGTFEKRAG